MRYRFKNTADDFSRDVAAFINLIGEGEYRRLLVNLGKGLNHKGYVTETDDLRYSLELQLLNLELLREKVAGHFPGVPTQIHEAADFVIGLGQTIPHLSAHARAKLRGQIIGGLKTNGLRALQHEMRLACMICKFGCDVAFADLEGDGGCDFLAEKNGVTYELEAKSLTIFSGQPIQPQDADKLFLILRQKFDGWKDEAQIPILTVKVKNRLSSSHADLLELVEACNTAASTRQNLAVGSNAAVQFLGVVPDAPYPKLAFAARLDALARGTNVYVSEGHPKIVVRLSSERPGRFVQNVIATISDASKKQFSGDRPGIIWVHIDYISPEGFDSMAYANNGISLFDLMALAVFDSPKRSHITQLVFSGGAHLVQKGNQGNSTFRRIVYTSPNCKFREAVLFREGKQLKREQPLRGSIAKALLEKAIINVAVAQSKGPIAVYDDVVAQFGLATELPQRELVAAALVQKGAALGSLGRGEEAIAVYDDLLARFGSAAELALRARVANALFNKGNVLGTMLGRAENAIAAYDDLVTRFGSSTELPLRELLAKALFNKGHALCALGRGDEGGAAYDDVAARFGNATELSLRELVARALVNKGRELGCSERAIEVYDDVLARFGSSTELPLREQIAKALLRKGSALAALDRLEEAVLAYRLMLSRFGSATEASLREEVARVLVSKGNALNDLHRSVDAITLYDEVLDLFGTPPELSLRVQVAAALMSKGGALNALERRGDAVAVYDDLVGRFGSANELPLRELVAAALVYKAVAFGLLGRSEEEIAVYDDLVGRFGTASEPPLREAVAIALFNKGVALSELGRGESAIAIYDDMLPRFGSAVELCLRERVASALVNKAGTLNELGHSSKAIAVCDDLLARLASASDLPLGELVAMALVIKGDALGTLGHSKNAIRSWTTCWPGSTLPPNPL